MPLESHIIAEARAQDMLAEALARKLPFKRAGGEHVGPCPRCGGRDRFSVNPRKGVFNCRGCAASGDVIAFVQHVDHCSFEEAVLRLTGRSREEASAPAKTPPRPAAADAGRGENIYRERERRAAYDIWRAGEPIAGTPAEAYLQARAVAVPPGAPLRYCGSLAYWHDGRRLHSGPAMLAAVTDDAGRFAGLHQTWIDPARPGKKAELADAGGDRLPAKKLRGSKRRAAIKLVTPPGALRMVMGEGLETTLAAWDAETRVRPKDAAVTAYWCAIDLGHMAGKAARTLPHPTQRVKDRRGRERPRRVPGPWPEAQPDRDLVIPDAIADLLLLGDGDSDPFTTGMALRRAAARFAREGRRIRLPMAPAGLDFNDVKMGADA